MECFKEENKKERFIVYNILPTPSSEDTIEFQPMYASQARGTFYMIYYTVCFHDDGSIKKMKFKLINYAKYRDIKIGFVTNEIPKKMFKYDNLDETLKFNIPIKRKRKGKRHLEAVSAEFDKGEITSLKAIYCKRTYFFYENDLISTNYEPDFNFPSNKEKTFEKAFGLNCVESGIKIHTD